MSGLDQVQRVEQHALATAYAEVEDQIVRSLVALNPEIAMGYAEDLIATGHMRGLQLMRLFYRLDQEWKHFKTDDTIEDYVMSRLGVSNAKFQTYRDIYKFVLESHPELAGKPVQGLQGLIAGAREGDFTDEDWEELAMAPDATTMNNIRRRVRGTLTSGHGRLSIWWERDGQVNCRRMPDGEIKNCGMLRRDTGDEDIDAAVYRLVNPDKTGVQKR